LSQKQIERNGMPYRKPSVSFAYLACLTGNCGYGISGGRTGQESSEAAIAKPAHGLPEHACGSGIGQDIQFTSKGSRQADRSCDKDVGLAGFDLLQGPDVEIRKL
jgi:hypothetical protein